MLTNQKDLFLESSEHYPCRNDASLRPAMLKFPLSLRLTTGFVVMMIGTLLLSESLNYHFRYLPGLVAVIAILGAAISLFIITRNQPGCLSRQ